MTCNSETEKYLSGNVFGVGIEKNENLCLYKRTGITRI